MYNLLKSEFFKLKRSSGFVVLLILSLVFGIISTISFAFGEIIGSGINQSGHDAYFLIFTDLRTLMLIFAGAFSGIFIGEDFSCRAFQAEIAMGNSRLKVMLNKTVVYMVGICLMIFIWLVVVLSGTTIVNGFGESLSFELIANMIRAGLVFSLHICACSMICVLVSVILKNKGSILAINFLLLVIIDGIFQVFSMLNDKGLTIYAKTPFIQSLLSASPQMSGSELLISISIATVSIMSLFSISYVVFRRCELK